MHWNRQQRRLLYLLVCFFIMSLYMAQLSRVLAVPVLYLRLIGLGILIVMGKVCHQEALPWQVPLYMVLYILLHLIPFQQQFGFFSPLAFLLSFLVMTVAFILIFKGDEGRQMLKGNILNLNAVFESPWSFPKRWNQVIPLFIVVWIVYWVLRYGVLIAHMMMPQYLFYIAVQAIQVTFACFTIPILFLRDRQEKGDLLIILGLCFGLFGRYLIMGNYLSILIYVAVGYLMAKATYETKGSLASILMLFFYFLLFPI